jgi:hypothetical protein
MVYMDFQKHYDSSIFIIDFLEEMVDSQLEVFYICIHILVSSVIVMN